MGSGEPTELMSRHDPTEVTRRHVFAQEGLPKKEEQALLALGDHFESPSPI